MAPRPEPGSLPPPAARSRRPWRPGLPFLLLGLVAMASLGLAGWQARAARQARAERLAALPGPIDVHFAQFMVLHHEQALLLAQIVLADPGGGVSRLAAGIQTQQLVELGEMRGWLELWNAPLVPATHDMYWLLQGRAPLDAATRQYLRDCRRAPGGMAGMASDAEVQALRVATGPTRDALFLALMRRHHEGGVTMARFAAREARLPAVRELAARVDQEQTEEIVGLRMAAARFPAQPRPQTPGPVPARPRNP